MPGILKRRNKNDSYTYRAQVRLKNGMPPQSKTFPTLVEARAWKIQEEAKRRQGMYLPSMTSKHKKLGETANRYLASLSVSLTYGVEEGGWLHANPCIRVTKFNEGSSRNRVLTHEEVDRLLAACKQSRCKALYPMIFLAMRSGMRLGVRVSYLGGCGLKPKYGLS